MQEKLTNGLVRLSSAQQPQGVLRRGGTRELFTGRHRPSEPQRGWKRRPWWQRRSFYWQVRNLMLAGVVGALVTQYAIKHNAFTLLGFDRPTANRPASLAASISEGFDLCDGPVRVSCVVDGNRDKDVYGRKLRHINRNGQSLGDVLIAEGLAAPWEGQHHAWC